MNCPKCGTEATKLHWNSADSGQGGVQGNIAGGHPVAALLGVGWIAAKTILSSRYSCNNPRCNHAWRVW